MKDNLRARLQSLHGFVLARAQTFAAPPADRTCEAIGAALFAVAGEIRVILRADTEDAAAPAPQEDLRCASHTDVSGRCALAPGHYGWHINSSGESFQ